MDEENKIIEETPVLTTGFTPEEAMKIVDTKTAEALENNETTMVIHYYDEGQRAQTYFEKCSKYADEDIPYPKRATPYSVGYDMVAAKDVVIEPYADLYEIMKASKGLQEQVLTLDQVANLTKELGTRPTLIPTGYKCRFPAEFQLELANRSSSPLKYWLLLANGVGKIEADYYNNENNEGEIFFQYINLSPYPIKIKKGDVLGQAILTPYYKLDIDVFKPDKRAGGFGSTNGTAPSA